MILLLGGTSDTDPFIDGLHAIGCDVCLSLATGTGLVLKNSPECMIRGQLDRGALQRCIHDFSITAIIDSTHPYAVEIKKTAREVAVKNSIPYFRYVRPSGLSNIHGIALARDHDEAAQIACIPGSTVLVTIGSKHIGIYAATAASTGCRLVARVLDEKQSVAACRTAGIPEADIIAEKGPFSVERNREHIRTFNASVVVSKDSGSAGGVTEKMRAAQLEGCRFVLVQRPPVDELVPYESREALLRNFAVQGKRADHRNL